MTGSCVVRKAGNASCGLMNAQMPRDTLGQKMSEENDKLIMECWRERCRLEVEEFQLWELREEINQRIEELRKGINELSDRSLAKKFGTTPTRVRRVWGLTS